MGTSLKRGDMLAMLGEVQYLAGAAWFLKRYFLVLRIFYSG